MPYSASCPSCSASMEVEEHAFSAFCPSCQQWSTVAWEGTVPILQAFEDVSEPLAAEHRAGADPLAEPARTPTAASEELEQLDRDWEFEARKYHAFNLMTGYGPPEIRTGVAVAAGLIGMGVWITMKTNALLGFIITLSGMGFFFLRYQHCTAYEDALKKYQRRRRVSTRPAPDPKEAERPLRSDE